MPGGKAKDLSHTFPRPSVKVEDIWNEVCYVLPITRATLTGISISSTMFLRFVFDISCSAVLLDRNIYPRAAMPANLFLSLLSQVRNLHNQAVVHPIFDQGKQRALTIGMLDNVSHKYARRATEYHLHTTTLNRLRVTYVPWPCGVSRCSKYIPSDK